MLSDLRIPQAVVRTLPVLALSGIVLAGQSAPPQGAGGRGAFAPTESASIAGTVTTDNGQPVAGVTVRVMDRTVAGGDPGVRYTTRLTARTDARGEYRLGLLAGDYIVDIPLTQVTMPVSVLATSAGGPSGGVAAVRNQRIADSMGPSPYFAGRRIGGFSFQTMGDQGPAPLPAQVGTDVVQVYPATIFAGVRTTREARVITLRAGETVRADMRLPAVRGARVSGTLRGSPDEVGSMTIRLLPVMDDLELFRDSDFEQALTVTDERGLFTFLGVPAGKYTLKVLYLPSSLATTVAGGRGEPARVGARGGGAPTEAAMAFVRRAEAVVDVGDADVTGLDVALTPAIRVTGTIRASDATATPDFSQARIMLYSNRPVTVAPPSPVAVGVDGSFTVRLYGPGLYRAQVSGVPGFTTGGTSVNGAAPQQWLTVPHEDLASVTVGLTAQPAVLGRGVPPGVRTGPPPSAPPPPANPDNAFVAGRVIDGATNAPLANTTVALQRVGDAAALRRVVVTDESGSFTFGDAVAGSYTVTTAAAGYSPSAFGRLRADGSNSTLGLAARESVSVTIRMWRPGQIFGEVRNARHQPIAGLPVVSIQVTQSGLRRDYVLQSFSRTTATGTFRFSPPPGEYLVCTSLSPTTIPDSIHQAYLRELATAGRAGSSLAALLAESGAATPMAASVPVGPLRFLMGSPESSAAPMPAQSSPNGEIRTYRSLCSPASASLADATPIHVGAGANHGPIILTLPDVPTVRLAGTVRGPAGPIPNLGVRLVRELRPNEYLIGSERLEAAAAISDARGAFSFLGVPAGRYLLRAWTTHVESQTPPALPQIGRPVSRPSGVTLWAEMPVTVADSNLLDLAVTLTPTARVTGRVVFDGSAPPPTQFPVALSTRQQFDPPLPSATASAADGSFTLLGYPPGHYNLPSTQVGAWRITAATLNGKPVTGHTLDITTAEVSGLVLTATDRFTTLAGQVAPIAGMAPVDAMVCIFPADYRGWFASEMSTTQLRLFRPSGLWTYTATWLPPGDYLAVVYREADGAAMTAAFIERLAKVATPVTLRLGERTTLDLALAPIR